MNGGRLIGLMLAILVGIAGCVSTSGGDGSTARRTGTTSSAVMPDPAQIFNDEPQAP